MPTFSADLLFIETSSAVVPVFTSLLFCEIHKIDERNTNLGHDHVHKSPTTLPLSIFSSTKKIFTGDLSLSKVPDDVLFTLLKSNEHIEMANFDLNVATGTIKKIRLNQGVFSRDVPQNVSDDTKLQNLPISEGMFKKIDLGNERPSSITFIKNTIEIAENVRRTLSSNDNLNPRIKMTMKINIRKRIGQIANSRSQIIRICFDLTDLYHRSHPSQKLLIIESIVDSILSQCEISLESNYVLCYPLAYATIELMNGITELGPILVNELIKVCPYTIPIYPKQKDGISELAFMKISGYKITEDGVVESELKYFGRMSAYIIFFAALIQTNSLSGCKNYIDRSNGWRWMASILNMPPMKITSQLLSSFIEVAGFEMLKCYKDQFAGLLNFLHNDFIKRLPKESVSSNSRLRTLIEESLKNGKCVMKEPHGRNPEP